MRLPVFTCHQVVINTSQFDFRENNEACVYLLPTGLQQHAQFTIKTTTELVEFYSLNIENKEHHMLIVKMLTKKIWQSFFQFIQLAENQHILINFYLSFLGIRWLCRKKCGKLNSQNRNFRLSENLIN